MLDRGAASSDLISAQIVLANGGGLAGVMSAVANSAEARSDMAGTYAAIGAAGPSQAEFNAFADAMSTSYGAPIELVSVDPGSGQQTELADTGITNLLAELPVLETTANGVNLGLRLADGTQIQFASTARLADFLYATAVQQMQATSFVTDNFNLDVQWLTTVDQPLLNEAVGWNEHAAALRALGGANYDQQAVEANTMASLALQIAAQPPASRQNLTVTIANPVAGNPTHVTAYAGGGGSIHDTTPGIGTYIESVISLGLNIAAAVSGQAYLYFAAAAVDAARSGQAFSNGQDLQGLLTLAQAVAAGITGGAGGTAPGTPAPVPAQVLNAAAQGVGGVYGAVQSAANRNAAGMLAGALEAAAAGAAGIGLSYGGQTQTALNLISAALGSAGIATNMASDFASGNLGQGLLDSLNLYLPAVAQAFASDQTAAQEYLSPSTSGSSPAASATETLVPAGGLASSGGVNNVAVTEGGATYILAVQSETTNNGSTVTLDTIANALSNWALDKIKYLGSEAAQLLDMTVPASTSASNMSTEQTPLLDNNGNPILDIQGEAMMMPANANPATVTDIGSQLASMGSTDGLDSGGALVGVANLALFRHGGAWDFQRVGPSQTFVGSFTDYANFEIGAYAASIGMSLDDALGISNQYARIFSNFGSVTMDATYPDLPASNAWDIRQGYSLYSTGKIGHH